MPNHFHLMVYVNHTEVDEQLIIPSTNPGAIQIEIPGATQSRTRNTNPEILDAIPGPTSSRTRNPISFNKSIGIMLASYTRAINKQFNWSGSLFRSETKAVCLTEINGISPVWITNEGITQITVHDPDLDYPNVCFNYILNNPVKDKLVSKSEDWEFSSSPDFLGIRNGELINRSRIKEFGLRLI